MLCRWGGQAPIFQGMFFPNSQIRSGSCGQWLCVSWRSEGCYKVAIGGTGAVHYLYQTWNKMKLRFSRYHKRKSQSGMNSGYYDHFKKQLFYWKFKRSTLLSGFPCTRQLSRRQDVGDVSRWDVPQKNRYLTRISNDFSVGRGYQFGGTVTCPDYPPEV